MDVAINEHRTGWESSAPSVHNQRRVEDDRRARIGRVRKDEGMNSRSTTSGRYRAAWRGLHSVRSDQNRKALRSGADRRRFSRRIMKSSRAFVPDIQCDAAGRFFSPWLKFF
jgi:hypothetical protein